MKHKHYDVIIALANGEQIQIHDGEKWLDWTASFLPEWIESFEFRIKPKKVIRWKWAFKNDGNALWTTTYYFFTEDELVIFHNNMNLSISDFVKLDWTRTEFPE